MSKINLNKLSIDVDRGEDIELENYSIKLSKPQFDEVEVVLRNLEETLIKKIEQFKEGAIFGCVAWLTSKPILKALKKCKNVQIIVQKEDFLRPDLDIKNNWKEELRRLYNEVQCDMIRYDFREPIKNLSVCNDPTVQGIRCVGNHNSDKKSSSPRAHHKFLVFCKLLEEEYVPITLWTGSYNLTKNATFSFENALVLTDKSGKNEVLEAYLNEHHQIFALSEELNWENKWIEPQYRIGT